MILQSKTYNDKADVWSLGCIIAALALKVNKGDQNLKHIFKGASCFPISPHLKKDDELLIEGIHKNDQMIIILETIGK